MSGSQFDLFEAERRKSDGMDLLWNNNAAWIVHGLELANRHLPVGVPIMGEDFKRLPGIGQPSSPNAWGKLVSEARRLRLIVPTSRYAKAKSVGNHAHKYVVYVRLRGPPP